MFYDGISAETQPFFIANSVIFSHAFHTLYLLKFTRFGLYSVFVVSMIGFIYVYSKVHCFMFFFIYASHFLIGDRGLFIKPVVT
jgi:hypothetical protein